MSNENDKFSASASTSASRTRSALNLTSSTLFGIFAPDEGSSTPWGSGAQTPSLRAINEDNRPPVIGAFQQPAQRRSVSQQRRATARNTFIPLALRTTLLFVLGIAYGAIVIHLHDERRLTPVKVEGMEQYSWWYLPAWGVTGILLGNLMPWVDTLWENTVGDHTAGKTAKVETKGVGSNKARRPASLARSDLGAGLTPIIRGIGAFFGVAFAIVSQLSYEHSHLELTSFEAEAAVGIDFTGVPYLSTCEPCALVSGRPVQGRVSSLFRRWTCRHGIMSWYQPKYGAPTRCCYTFPTHQYHEQPLPKHGKSGFGQR